MADSYIERLRSEIARYRSLLEAGKIHIGDASDGRTQATIDYYKRTIQDLEALVARLEKPGGTLRGPRPRP